MTDHPHKSDPKKPPRPAASAPKSVREGLGALRSRRGPRRSGRPEGRNGAQQRTEPPEAERMGDTAGPVAPRTRRCTTGSRTFTAGGEEWMVTLVGSAGATATAVASARLLAVEVHPPDGGPVRSAYLAATDLGDVTPDELERLALRPPPDLSDGHPGEGPGGKRRKGRSGRAG